MFQLNYIVFDMFRTSKCSSSGSVHPQEHLYMQFYDICFMQPYKQSGRWQDVLDNVTSVHFVGSYYVGT
jgi:hypothetical protein